MGKRKKKGRGRRGGGVGRGATRLIHWRSRDQRCSTPTNFSSKKKDLRPVDNDDDGSDRTRTLHDHAPLPPPHHRSASATSRTGSDRNPLHQPIKKYAKSKIRPGNRHIPSNKQVSLPTRLQPSEYRYHESNPTPTPPPPPQHYTVVRPSSCNPDSKKNNNKNNTHPSICPSIKPFIHTPPHSHLSVSPEYVNSSSLVYVRRPVSSLLPNGKNSLGTRGAPGLKGITRCTPASLAPPPVLLPPLPPPPAPTPPPAEAPAPAPKDGPPGRRPAPPGRRLAPGRKPVAPPGRKIGAVVGCACSCSGSGGGI